MARDQLLAVGRSLVPRQSTHLVTRRVPFGFKWESSQVRVRRRGFATPFHVPPPHIPSSAAIGAHKHYSPVLVGHHHEEDAPGVVQGRKRTFDQATMASGLRRPPHCRALARSAASFDDDPQRCTQWRRKVFKGLQSPTNARPWSKIHLKEPLYTSDQEP
jgi:hypothetical protein